MHWVYLHWVYFYSAGGWLICAAMLPVVLRRQFAPGAAWAWLGIVFLHPYIGLGLYMLVGENQLSPGRAEDYRKVIAQFRVRSTKEEAAGATGIPEVYRPMALQAEKMSGLPVLSGNSAEFLTESAQMIQRLCADIDAARQRVHLLYYIYSGDGTGARVTDAVIRAAARGVECRVMIDAVASRPFFRVHGPAKPLVAAGVKIGIALPVTSFRRGISRMDMRNHRKLALIDDAVAFVGSHNLIDPSYGGRRGNPWIDLSARLTGPVVADLSGVFREDWAFETGEILTALPAAAHSDGGIPMQIVPTGPIAPGETYRRLLLAAIQSARRQLILTTPYFVPDDPTMVDLLMAADRGVQVKLILPLVSDNRLTAAAARAQFGRLTEAGVEIYQYRPGLLHAKTTTVDDAFSLFGSANLDVRSFNLNFELSVLMYGAEVTEQIRTIQTGYMTDSNRIDPSEWKDRSAARRYADGAVSLVSPLL